MNTPRPWWLVWAASAIVPATTATALGAIYFGAKANWDPVVPFGLAWPSFIAAIWGVVMAVALGLAGTALLIVISWERERVRSFGKWFFAGWIVTLMPILLIAGSFLNSFQSGAPADAYLEMLIVATIAFTLAALGAAAGRLTRHGSLRA